MLKNPLDFKEILQAINQRCASSETIKYAIEQLQEILKKVKNEESKNEGGME